MTYDDVVKELANGAAKAYREEWAYSVTNHHIWLENWIIKETNCDWGYTFSPSEEDRTATDWQIEK